jgi:DNA polymerase-3 subunit alpha
MRRRRGALLRRRRQPIEKAIENMVAGLRMHLSPSATEIDALRRRLETAASPRGGEVSLVAALGGGREIEMKLPGRYTLDASLRGALKTAPGVALLEDV